MIKINFLCKINAMIEAYVQGRTEVQFVYPTDLFLSTILLQFQQSVINFAPKFTMLTKIMKT